MVDLGDIVSYCDDYLGASEFSDYCPNGLQVEGRSKVDSIASGVSASYDLFAIARDLGADLVLVHHGLIWGSGISRVEGFLRRRLRVLLENEISLLAYHLPLDASCSVGNNAVLGRKLGICRDIGTFASYKGRDIGFIGSLYDEASGTQGLSFDDFRLRLRGLFGDGAELACYDYGRNFVTKVAIVTGAGQNNIVSALRAGADVFITGEVSEPTMHIAKEEGINFIALGHYNTETFGVRALGAHLAGKFGLEHRFIDIPNSA